MNGYTTPGVHIEHVLTEPKRVLQTGVPVFLALVRQEDLDAYNLEQPDPEEEFITKPSPKYPKVRVARKRGYLRLPKRPSLPVETRTGDPYAADPTTYLRAVGLPRSDERIRQQVRASGGAAGPPGGAQAVAPDEDAPPEFSSKPQRFTLWPQFEATYGDLRAFGFFTYAVRGFFENGGSLCYVQLLAYLDEALVDAVDAGLEICADYDEYDLVCAPDLMWRSIAHGGGVDAEISAMQSLLRHCETLGNRFAILDSQFQVDAKGVLEQRQHLNSDSAALYYPWVRVSNGPVRTGGFVPPCGHVAGVIARTDRRIGVHKAPANEVLEGVVDLAVHLSDGQQGPLNELRVNCLRAFPRRGLRIWGARTLSVQSTWMYINERRIFTTAARWIERNLVNVLFEPHSPALWAQIVRDLTVYFTRLLEQGALAGAAARQAFYVKCDAETNPPEEREIGKIVTEIGLATTAPAEFIVVRIIHSPAGVRILGPV
jgi:hypothetical protein